MRWGLTFLAWALIAAYLADSCLDYVRIWQNPPPGYTRAELWPRLTACGEQKSIELAMATAALVAFYYASGWALARFRPSKKSET
jgi:hypothetical protein